MAPGGVVTLGNPRRPVASPKGGGKELLLPAVGALAIYLLCRYFRRPICRYFRRFLAFFGLKGKHAGNRAAWIQKEREKLYGNLRRH